MPARLREKKFWASVFFLLTPYSLYAKNVLSEGGRVMKMQFDLFDQDAAKAGVGERQTDLESLLALVQAKDEKKQAEWMERAKAGEVMRIM
jgi:hypothetical protein